jgi:hypothetical protein
VKPGHRILIVGGFGTFGGTGLGGAQKRKAPQIFWICEALVTPTLQG